MFLRVTGHSLFLKKQKNILMPSNHDVFDIPTHRYNNIKDTGIGLFFYNRINL